jgi:hypothetical protein
VDGEAINLEDESLRSHSVLSVSGKTLKGEGLWGAERPRLNVEVCWSGVDGGQACGKVFKKKLVAVEGRVSWEYKVIGPAAEGDSGGPVWNPETHRAVGQISTAERTPTQLCHHLLSPVGPLWCPRMTFTPILPPEGESQPPGIAPRLGVELLKEG